jgi:hypothetical protein
MAGKPAEEPELLNLIRAAESSRAFLGNEAAALQHKLDVAARLKGSLKHHPGQWLAGSMAAGLAASLLMRRRPARSERPRTGFVSGLVLTAARPLLTFLIESRMKRWLGQSRGDGPTTF